MAGADTMPRPASDVVDAVITDSGVLYVLSLHSSTTWGGVKGEDAFNGQNYVSVVEAIDTKMGQLVGRAELRGYPVAIMSGLQVATYRDDRDGFPHLDIWQLDLTVPPR